MIDRLLSWTAGSDPATERAQVVAFRRFLLLYGAVRSWLWLPFLDAPTATVEPLPIGLSAFGLSVCAVLAFTKRAGWIAPRLALPLLLFQLAITLPFTDNHFFLEILCMGLLALPGPRDADADLALRSLRWLGAVVLFQTGLQKILYGHYLHGDFLAFMAATSERFAPLAGLAIEPAALESLRGLDVFETGAGPFRTDSLALRVASNGVVLAELALPFGLVAARTRAVATGLALALVLAIQLGAREIGFALLFSNLLVLFTATNWSHRLLLASAALLLAAGLAVALFGAGWLARGML